MADPASWHPILALQALRPGGPPQTARLCGEDLVLWCTAAGVPQAWRARCPHRGVHLGLGRVLGDRLACAYHGWEFEAGSGRCMAIPALADRAGVPGQVRAEPCATWSDGAMLWVRLDAGSEGAAPPQGPAAGGAPGRLLRMLTLRAGVKPVRAHLRDAGFTPLAEAVWRGTLADRPLQLYLHPMHPELTGACAWDGGTPGAEDLDAALDSLRQLRLAVESAADPSAEVPQ